ncbi:MULTISPECIES: hypothetical protein [Photorhabdus]|uniref:Uncharacterized protein n=1 Tax=Photorhabdus asymbiotica TaxID=291112 RepID=A0ABX9SP78_9GAMM|nr:hypothetical protein [Photorhabdus asymbiotica]RKS59848.1 hypothetical protein BDD30_1944 [Photorhabdus asymbiotica]
MRSKKKSNRAKVGKPISMTFGVNQRRLISDKVNEKNITPKDFIINSGIEAAKTLLEAKS